MQKTVSTEPLAQILRSIMLQRRTGSLHIEQLREGDKEQGKIYFERGAPIHAQTGYETGKAAFLRMSSWKNITCSFDGIGRSDPTTHTHLTTPTHSRNFQPRITQPLVKRDEPPEEAKITPKELGPRMRPTVRLIPQTSPLRATQLPEIPRSQPLSQAILPTSGQLAVFRQRATVIQAEFFQQMERRERIVFILLDGSRTIQDIARLIHCNESEVELILMRLAMRGYAERVLNPQPAPTLQEKLVDIFFRPNLDEDV
jgi:hypothetical protein